jgi:hypothetical protein
MNSSSPIGNGSSALQSALLGIDRGMTNLARDQETIAQSSAGLGSGAAITGALVDAQQQKLAVEASVKALSITDQTLGSLLDIKA